MKYGLNEEEVCPNELPGLQQGPPGEGAGRRAQPLRRKKGVRAMPRVCQASLSPGCSFTWRPRRPWHLGSRPDSAVPKGSGSRTESSSRTFSTSATSGRPSCFFQGVFCVDLLHILSHVGVIHGVRAVISRLLSGLVLTW